MNGHYISFKDQPESTERTMSVGEFTVQVMHMVYKITDCIVHLRTKNGPTCLSDAISVILDEHDIVKATFMPSNVTIDVAVDDIEYLKKLIYFMYPDITNTNKYGRHNLIDLDRTMPDTVPARRGARMIPEVTAIPMDGTHAVM